MSYEERYYRKKLYRLSSTRVDHLSRRQQILDFWSFFVTSMIVALPYVVFLALKSCVAQLIRLPIPPAERGSDGVETAVVGYDDKSANLSDNDIIIPFQ